MTGNHVFTTVLIVQLAPRRIMVSGNLAQEPWQGEFAALGKMALQTMCPAVELLASFGTGKPDLQSICLSFFLSSLSSNTVQV